MFKTKVIAIDLSYEETIDDRDFYKNPVKKSSDEEEIKKKRRYVRLQLIDTLDSDALKEHHLKEYGFKTPLKKAVKCRDDKIELFKYIDECFEVNNSIAMSEKISDGYECLEDDEIYYEGSVTTVKVNKYERNPEARRKCIEIHGCKCKICDFDFERIYGEVGKGLIHVHHVVPISSIKKEYQIDYEKDLIPVCPNCHAVIHRQKVPYTIEEIRGMLIRS